MFDALVLCNGHFSVPRTPAVAGAAAFPGRQMHSHSYRDARPFAGQTVVVVGAAASGEDISREVADIADTARPATAHALPGPYLIACVIIILVCCVCAPNGVCLIRLRSNVPLCKPHDAAPISSTEPGAVPATQVSVCLVSSWEGCDACRCI